MRGAALVIALILLIVMSLLAVSSMTTATLELTMAGNAERLQSAFQAAEAGIELALSRLPPGGTSDFSVPITVVGAGETEALGHFVETTPVPDRAFSLGVGADEVRAFHFEITSAGRAARGATSTHVQGVYELGPIGQ